MTSPGRRRNATLLLLLALSIVLTATMRYAVHARREALQRTPVTRDRLQGMDTFALGLVLGGLRGPLVMYLWTSTENQKIDKDLEDIHTKIELIRMLQPEFKTVHIFQMWNIAYNLSVQVSAITNKYGLILGGVDYGKRVDAEHPDDVNILASLADLYFNKLGNSMEAKIKDGYIDRVRRETLPHGSDGEAGGPGGPAAAPGGVVQAPSVQVMRTEHEVLLQRGPDGFVSILPQYLKGRTSITAKAEGELPAETYTGAELQFLDRYDSRQAGGFPYGLSPNALGYNYYERARILMRATGQKHVQLSDLVIDSRPAVALKHWSEEEWLRARRLEAHLFLDALAGRPTASSPLSDEETRKLFPEERWDFERVSAKLPADARFNAGPFTNRQLFGTPQDAARSREDVLAEVLFSLRRAILTSEDARLGYRRHLRAFGALGGMNNYVSTIEELAGNEAMMRADAAYLRLLAANAGLATPGGGDRSAAGPQSPDALRDAARKAYREALTRYYRIALRYYVDPPVADPIYARYQVNGQPLTRATITQHEDPAREDPQLHAHYPAIYRDVVAEYTRYANEMARQANQPPPANPLPEDLRQYDSLIARAQQRLANLPER